MNFTNILNEIIADPAFLAVYRHLSKHPEGLTGRGLATLIGVSPFKINHSLRHLAAQGIITVTAVGRAHLYRLQNDHIVVQQVIFPLLKFESTLLKNLGEGVMQRLTPRPLAIIVFGSVARGEAGPRSDLDLFFIYTNAQSPGRGSDTFNHIAEYVARVYGTSVTMGRSDVSQFQERARDRDPLVRNIIKEGRSIAGLSMTEILDYGAHD